MRMEALLHQPKQLANFVQYMKSINCSTTMTVLLLMCTLCPFLFQKENCFFSSLVEVMNKIEMESVSPGLCQRLKAPLRQLLHLLHSGRVLASEDLDQPHSHWDASQALCCSICGRVMPPSTSPQLPPLLGLPPRLTVVIAEAIDVASPGGDDPDSLRVAGLVHTPEWTT